MTDLEIRLITPDDDFAAQVDLGQRAFGTYSPGQRASWLHVASLRASQGMFLGAFVKGQPAGAAMLHDMRQYWVGSAVPCAGVASVKVAPEYRGSGIGRRLMTELLDLIAARGYPLSALYPATMPVYRSIGYELAGAKYQFAVPARSLRSLLAPDPFAAQPAGQQDPHGRGAAHGGVPIRRASPADAALVVSVIGRSHEQARDAGPITWDEGPAARWLAREDLYAYLAGDNGDDGFTAYRWLDGNDGLWVERVHATGQETLRALWSVIASHSSTADKVCGWIAPNDPLWWLTHERDASLTYRSMWMLRVVDAKAATEARGFPPGISITVPLEIKDSTRPANTGSWQLTVADGKGMIAPNECGSSPAPLTMGPRGVAALYAGTPVHALRMAGLASGGTPDSDAALTAAFAATPYMVDDF